MRALIWTPILAFAIVAGCQPKSGGVAAETPVDAPATQQPKDLEPDLSQIPAELKHDGYSYYGLSNTKPMKLEVSYSDPAKGKLVGEQTFRMKEMKDGKAFFSIYRTGQLEALGAQELRVDKDGVYNSASTIAKIGPNDIEIPADLSPGKTWTAHTEVDQPGQSMINDSVCKVVRVERVKTKAGEHEALLITSTGKGTINKQAVSTATKTWYVRDLGAVKVVLTTTMARGKVETITIQEIK